MKVLTKNIILFYYCKRHKDQQCQGDVLEICSEPGSIPRCEKCGHPMVLKEECLVTN